MEAIAHDRAFAAKVGVPQRVGKDFTAADKASGRYQGKGSTMAKHSEGGLDGSKGYSARKGMGMGTVHGGGNFGVDGFGGTHHSLGDHPDATSRTGQKAHMEDSERAVGHPIHHTRHHHPSQAAPHHGPHHVDGYAHHHAKQNEKV